MPRRWLWLRRGANVAVGVVLLLWGLLLAAWLLLHWLILPHIDEWRPAIERHASAAVGAQLTIGRIDVRSGGWVPAFDVHDLRLVDRQGREALRLARVQLALAPQALLALKLRFAQVLVDGARLEVRRDAAGRLLVAGFDWDAGSAEQGARIRDWVLSQAEFVFRDAEVQWSDQTRDAPAVTLTDVDLVLRNGVRRHALRVDATPPSAWGERFSLRGRFTQPLLAAAGDFLRWSGTLYAELPRADVAELRRHVALPFELDEGDGALRVWVEMQSGQSRQFTVDLALRSVSMRLAAALQPIDLEQIRGRVEALRDADGIRLQARQLQFVTGDGLHWPAGELRLAWRQKQDLQRLPPSDAPVEGGEFSADRLDLDLLARAAARLPLRGDARRWLESLAPQGIVESLEGRWEGAPAAPSRYRVKAQVGALNLAAAALPAGAAPAPVRPGLRGARVRIDASEAGGEAQLSIKRGALIFPGLWDEAELPLDELEAQLAWRIVARSPRAPQLELTVREARFANADAAGEFRGRWRTGDGEGSGRGARFPGRIELDGSLQRADASRIARYLPLEVSPSARDYVRAAIRAGHATSATFRVAGDLWDFPFDRVRDGEFRVRAKAQDVEFAVVPGDPARPGREASESPWPTLSRVAGTVEFDRAAMRLRDLRATLWGTELHDVAATIADLGADAPVLDVDGQARGPVADLLRLLRSTPLAGWIGPAVQSVSASGGSELKLALKLPIDRPEQASVRGSLQFGGGELRLRADLPVLDAARGRVDFTQRDFTLRGATARLLGGDASFEGGIAADGSLRLAAQGVASAEALRAAPGLGQLARLAQALQGQAGWRASLVVLRGAPELTITSNLVGLQIDLPAPLGKPAAAAWPMRLHTGPLAAPAASGDAVQFDLGDDLLKLRLQRQGVGDEARVVRGSVAVRDALPEPAPAGVAAALNLDRVDVDAWQAVVERFADGASPRPDAWLDLRRARLRAAELRSGSRRLSNVDADLQRGGTPADPVWTAQVRADQLDGRIEVRLPAPPARAGQVMARFDRLSLPPADVAGVEELLGQPPVSVPALDIVVQDFELRGRKLGRLEVQAVNRRLPGRAGAREWQLDKLALTMPEAQLAATGRWIAGGNNRMQTDFTLDLADGGAFAERLGAGKALRGGKGRIKGQLGWAGSPLAIDYPSLEGRLDIALESGQVLQADPGGARLLGVLSLQALPRRLTLDFRDLFQEGFAFDGVTGEVTIANGVATTNNLRMRGVQAAVLMEGSTDLQRETQDMQVVIVPNIDATGAALAGFAFGPAIGLSTLVAQWVLREPLIAANTREYRVTGSWSDPVVQQVKRTPSAPAPAAPPAEAAPASPTAPRPSG